MKDKDSRSNDSLYGSTVEKENAEKNKSEEKNSEEHNSKEYNSEKNKYNDSEEADREKSHDSSESSGKTADADEQKNKGSKGRNAAGKALEVLIYILIIFVCVKLVPMYVVQRTIVDGDSMESTLQNNDNLLVEKISLYFSSPKRFDVVVFYPYGKSGLDKDEAGNTSGLTEKEIKADGAPYYIKRVIGLPGETVQIKGSSIYINGHVLKENYGKDPITDAGNIFDKPVKLADDEYFVLGDNRQISYDSRYIGPVKKKNIRGCAVLRIYPFSKFGTIN